MREAGDIVRLPNGGKGGDRRVREFRCASGGPARGSGTDTLKDFSAKQLEGAPLPDAEWQAMLDATAGLALVAEKWVGWTRDASRSVALAQVDPRPDAMGSRSWGMR